MFTKLKALESRYQLGRVSDAEAADGYSALLLEYAAELPMSAREQA